GFEERVVPLDDASRRIAGDVVAIVGRALAAGFLPALPTKGACRWCDYRPVCGPNEEVRTARKPSGRLTDLAYLRSRPGRGSPTRPRATASGTTSTRRSSSRRPPGRGRRPSS